MPDFSSAVTDLRAALGAYLLRGRTDSTFHVQLVGTASVPELGDLSQPEIHLGRMPGELTRLQQRALEQLGYRTTGQHWEHPDGWTLVLPALTTGWRAEQHALCQFLPADAEARTLCREVYLRDRRRCADRAVREATLNHYAITGGFAPALFVAP